MVNRVLIRIKVVQMLYSYLLTQSEFKIETPPSSPSRDRRYAYATYIDMLLLLMQLSGLSVGEVKAVDVPAKLASNKVGKSLAANDVIRTAILRGNTHIETLANLVPGLLNIIEKSDVFDKYKRRMRNDISDDVNFWTTVFESIIANNTDVADALRADDSFTIAGLQQGIEMMCSTLRSYSDSRQLLVKAKNDLETSLDKAYELYLRLLKLIIDITDEQERRLDYARNKFNATASDLNPNTRLLDNALVAYLNASDDFNELVEKYKLRKDAPNAVLVDKLLDSILASDLYRKYAESPVSDFAGDVEFWRNVMRSIILPSTILAEDLEDKSVYWNDDLEIMGTFVIKTIKRIETSEGAQVPILPKFKDDEDSRFGSELFTLAVNNRRQYREYIDRFIDNAHWDPERMAFMDIVIMIAAIAEIINFPKIPVPVSINEYVEIANDYSTEKSGAFVNGILFSVVKYLKENGIINKQ